MNQCLKFERLRKWRIRLIWKLILSRWIICTNQKIEQAWSFWRIKKKEILSKFLIRINKHFFKHFTFNFTSHWNLSRLIHSWHYCLHTTKYLNHPGIQVWMINNKSIVPYRTGLPISRSFLNVRLQYSAALYIHEDQLNYNTRFLMDIKIFLHRFRQMISNACNYKRD